MWFSPHQFSQISQQLICIVWFALNFTQIGQEIWKAGLEICFHPEVKYDSHWTDLHATWVPVLNAWKSDRWSICWYYLTDMCGTYGAGKKCVQFFLGKAEDKRPLERSRHRWVYNIKISFKEIGWDAVGWIDWALERGMCQTCEHGNELLGSIQCGDLLTAWGTVSFFRKRYVTVRQMSKCGLHIKHFIFYFLFCVLCHMYCSNYPVICFMDIIPSCFQQSTIVS